MPLTIQVIFTLGRLGDTYKLGGQKGVVSDFVKEDYFYHDPKRIVSREKFLYVSKR